MRNKNKNLIFLCDINGTITSCNISDEKTIFHDTFHANLDVRQQNLVKLARAIVELKKVEDCDKAYFSFFSDEDKEAILYRVTEVKEIFDEYGIEIRVCGCNGSSFSGYIFFENNNIIYKEEKDKNNKMDLMIGIINNMQKNDCIIYAEDNNINREIAENYFLRKGFKKFKAIDSDCVINGKEKHGLKGLVQHLDELVETKKSKRKR